MRTLRWEKHVGVRRRWWVLIRALMSGIPFATPICTLRLLQLGTAKSVDQQSDSDFRTRILKRFVALSQLLPTGCGGSYYGFQGCFDDPSGSLVSLPLWSCFVNLPITMNVESMEIQERKQRIFSSFLFIFAPLRSLDLHCYWTDDTPQSYIFRYSYQHVLP